MNSLWWSVGALVLLALGAASEAAEQQRPQPLLLPMPQLLKQFDQQQEWLMLPLADYQALVAAGHRPTPADHGIPAGAWIETARLSGSLVDDRTLHLRAELEVVAAVAGPSRCRLFARLPDALGSATLASGPALTVAHDDGGLDLLLPGPGRHQAVVTWTVELSAAAADGSRTGSVPLPLAAGLAATLESGSPGELLGAGLSMLADQLWTVTRPSGSELALTWHPGRHGGDALAVWGAEQALQVGLPDDLTAPRAWRWSATPSVLRGQLPALLTLQLPSGWTATAPGTGVLEVTQVADGVLLRIDPAASELMLDGVATAAAPVALPTIAGATWQGGRVVLTNAGLVDWTLPPRWQRLALSNETAGAAWRAFAVPGPDAGMQLASTTATDGLSSLTTTTVAVGADRWRMDARLEIQSGSVERFTLPVRLPTGWRAVSATCSVAARIAGADAGGALTDTPADGVLRIDLPQGLKRTGTVVINLVLERDAPSGSQPQQVTPPGLDGADRIRHHLAIVSAPSIDLLIGGSGWQRATAVAVPVAATRVVRTVLETVGEAPALTLTATAKPATCDAEVVAWLLPIEGQQETAVWCRLDLRLTVSDGELEALALTLPLVPETIQVADPALALVRDGTRTLLQASRPWRGERLVRIEGRLADATGQRIGFPQVGVARADGRPVPTVLRVALQAPERLDLHLAPGAAAQAEDEDDLPHWSRAIPGDPLAGVWRIDTGKAAGEAGGFALVSRALVDPPAGFVQQLEVRTQLTAERALTLVRFRLAAPGLAALPLQLPAGCELLAATLDGHAVAVRRSAADAVIPLPGRTQVAVALLFAAPQAGAAVDLRLPGLGGLPITGLSWLVAADVAWRIAPLESPETIQLSPISGAVASRAWFTAWRDAAGVVDAATVAIPLVDEAAPASDDPRRLVPPTPAAAADGEPTLALVGQLWQGERLGGNARVALVIEPLDGLRHNDHLGEALAVLLGVWLAWRLRPSVTCVLAASALSGAVALHLSGLTVGPLLACCEWLAPVLVVVALIRVIAATRPVPVRRMETAP